MDPTDGDLPDYTPTPINRKIQEFYLYQLKNKDRKYLNNWIADNDMWKSWC